MKNSRNENIFHTNLLQALQKNKFIQGKLTECQRQHYVQLLKNMQTYTLEEKYNRELLYIWNKESYVRQLKKNLQEYNEQRFGQRDAYYEYQLQKIEGIIAGQQRLVVPVSEEDRRSKIHTKYLRFLRKNPLQSSTTSKSMIKSAILPTTGSNGEEDDDDEEEQEQEPDDVINARGIEETWKHIYAQSAVGPRSQPPSNLPSIHRSATIGTIRRNRPLAKSALTSKKSFSRNRFPTASSAHVQTSTNEHTTESSGVVESIEPLNLTSDTLDKHTRADLFTMRSVRRTRKDPSELNLIFETRKRVCEINRRATNLRFCQKKYNIPQKIFQFVQSKPTETTDENAPTSTDDNPSKSVEEKLPVA